MIYSKQTTITYIQERKIKLPASIIKSTLGLPEE